MLENMELNQLIDFFKEVNYRFLYEEKDLIISGVSERSWYNRFSIYLDRKIRRDRFNKYYVDTEYNRNDGKLKTIFDNNNLEIIPITCDVILHSRGHNPRKDNIICIEMKKSNSTSKSKMKDKKRIKLLTRKSYDGIWSVDGKTFPEHVCGYELGIYYEINIIKQEVYLEYYQDGEIIFDERIRF